MPESVVPCYDVHRDVLYACVEGVQDTESEPVAVDLFLLHDTRTGRVVGLECLDFSRRGTDEDWLRTVPGMAMFSIPPDLGRPIPLVAILRFLWRDARERRLFEREPEARLAGIAIR